MSNTALIVGGCVVGAVVLLGAVYLVSSSQNAAIQPNVLAPLPGGGVPPPPADLATSITNGITGIATQIIGANIAADARRDTAAQHALDLAEAARIRQFRAEHPGLS